MASVTQRGGKKIGQGFTGKGITLSSDKTDDTDTETLVGLLQQALGKGQVLRLHHGPDAFTVCRDPRRLLRECLGTRANRSRFLAKVMTAATLDDREETFRSELRQSWKVAASLSRVDLARWTTIGGPRFDGADVYGLEVHPAGFFATLSRRCSGDIDALAESITDSTSSLHAFVSDALSALAAVHKAGLVHSDVKLGNFVACGTSGKQGTSGTYKTYRTYRLIDWEKTESVEALTQRYLAHGTPRSFGSPLAWYAWGLPTKAAAVTSLGYYFTRRAPWMAKSGELRGFIASAVASFVRWAHAMPDAELRDRAALIRKYAASFDLFNLGVALMALVTVLRRDREDEEKRRIAHLATLLTHLDHEERLTDAASALRAWRGEGREGKS